MTLWKIVEPISKSSGFYLCWLSSALNLLASSESFVARFRLTVCIALSCKLGSTFFLKLKQVSSSPLLSQSCGVDCPNLCSFILCNSCEVDLILKFYSTSTLMGCSILLGIFKFRQPAALNIVFLKSGSKFVFCVSPYIVSSQKLYSQLE